MKAATLADVLNPRVIFRGRNGDDTKALYAFLDGLGPRGELATALFRAQKRSTFAKQYKNRGYRANAYDVKTWSLSEVCRILARHANVLDVRYGWRVDPKTRLRGEMAWVLYVDTCCGQASFHSPTRCQGPDYAGSWTPGHGSEETVLRYCEQLVWEACNG